MSDFTERIRFDINVVLISVCISSGIFFMLYSVLGSILNIRELLAISFLSCIIIAIYVAFTIKIDGCDVKPNNAPDVNCVTTLTQNNTYNSKTELLCNITALIAAIVFIITIVTTDYSVLSIREKYIVICFCVLFGLCVIGFWDLYRKP